MHHGNHVHYSSLSQWSEPLDDVSKVSQGDFVVGDIGRQVDHFACKEAVHADEYSLFHLFGDVLFGGQLLYKIGNTNGMGLGSPVVCPKVHCFELASRSLRHLQASGQALVGNSMDTRAFWSITTTSLKRGLFSGFGCQHSSIILANSGSILRSVRKSRNQNVLPSKRVSCRTEL